MKKGRRKRWGERKKRERRSDLGLVYFTLTSLHSQSGDSGFTYFSIPLALLDKGTTHYTWGGGGGEVRNCVVNFMYLVEMTDAVCKQEYHRL